MFTKVVLALALAATIGVTLADDPVAALNCVFSTNGCEFVEYKQNLDWLSTNLT